MDAFSFYPTEQILPFRVDLQYIGFGKECIIEIIPAKNQPDFCFFTLFREEAVCFERPVQIDMIPQILEALELAFHDFQWRTTANMGVPFNPWRLHGKNRVFPHTGVMP